MRDTLIFKDGTYRTENVRRPILARIAPTAWFYKNLFYVVFSTNVNIRWSRSPHEVIRRHAVMDIDILEKLGIPVEATGLDHLASLKTPCVIIGNHMSMLETITLPAFIFPFTKGTYVLKESLVKYPVFGRVLSGFDCIAVKRENPREDLKTVLEEGCKRLASGVSVIIFPQSTRSVVFDPAQFNSLGIKLARRAGVPVVPLALKTDALGTGKLVRDFGKIDVTKSIHFAFGKPFMVEGRGDEEHKTVVDFIASHLKQWGGQTAI